MSWQEGLGEAGSGDPRGVRRGEQVKSKVGTDLSAAAGIQNKHRCSNSWLQKLDKEKKVNIHKFLYIEVGEQKVSLCNALHKVFRVKRFHCHGNTHCRHQIVSQGFIQISNS